MARDRPARKAQLVRKELSVRPAQPVLKEFRAQLALLELPVQPVQLAQPAQRAC